MPMMAMQMTVARAASIVVRWFILIPNECCMRSCDTLDAAAKSCESAVDIVAARMPERIRATAMTARMAGNILRSSTPMVTRLADRRRTVPSGRRRA